MNDLENFLALVRFGRPERIPERTPGYGIHYRGCHHEDAQGVGHDRPRGESWKDLWGVGWHKDLDGVMGFPRTHPLADLTQVDAYRFPDPDDPALVAAIDAGKARFEAEGLQGTRMLCGSNRDTLWERAYMLVGMEDLMAAFYTDPELVHRLLDRILAFQLRIAAHYVRVGVQMADLSDDMGTQNALLLGERIFDTFFMPRYARLIDFYRAHGVLVSFHSCGHIQPLLPRFVELGIHILNPVQASANDLEAVRRVTRGRLVLHGAVDSRVVMEGTPEAVEACVRERIGQLGREGAYICSPDQGMPYPRENLDALSRAVARWGRIAW